MCIRDRDEAFETLTLVQTGKRDLMPIVLIDPPGSNYWSQWLDFVRDQLFDRQLISPEDLSLFTLTNSVEEATEEIMTFYSVYNSMRYVRGKLVLRLHFTPDDDFIERLNDEFGDIVENGRIEMTQMHRLESDDRHLRHLPRLAFRFNRRSAGRLRQMVDLINDSLGVVE